MNSKYDKKSSNVENIFYGIHWHHKPTITWQKVFFCCGKTLNIWKNIHLQMWMTSIWQLGNIQKLFELHNNFTKSFIWKSSEVKSNYSPQIYIMYYYIVFPKCGHTNIIHKVAGTYHNYWFYVKSDALEIETLITQSALIEPELPSCIHSFNTKPSLFPSHNGMK